MTLYHLCEFVRVLVCLGCYAFCAKDADNSYLDMSKPVENVVFFAGEHCCKETPDTVGGAYITGLRAAGHIERIGKEWPKEKAVEQFPFVAMASTLAKERDLVDLTDRPFAYQIDVRQERTDILVWTIPSHVTIRID